MDSTLPLGKASNSRSGEALRRNRGAFFRSCQIRILEYVYSTRRTVRSQGAPLFRLAALGNGKDLVDGDLLDDVDLAAKPSDFDPIDAIMVA